MRTTPTSNGADTTTEKRGFVSFPASAEGEERTVETLWVGFTIFGLIFLFAACTTKFGTHGLLTAGVGALWIMAAALWKLAFDRT